MVMVKDLTELTLKDYWEEVKEQRDWWGDLKKDVLAVVKRLMESAMEEEIVEQLRVAKYERGALRRGYRNGYRYRSLLTEFGLVDVIKVPRDREGIYDPQVIERYARRQDRVNRLVREMFLGGVSTRKVQEMLGPIIETSLSAQSVSRITRSLDSEVRRFHERGLVDTYRYLFLDGITLKVKGVAGAKKRMVLCAYGIRDDGIRELISFRQASCESAAQWEAFLNDLYRRGLEGRSLELITTDGCPGLHQALQTVFPYIRRQRCWAHKLRNIASKMHRRNQEQCLGEAKQIYQADTLKEARSAFAAWSSKWAVREAGAVACLQTDIDEMLSFLQCPAKHWRKVRTTNAIERAFREVRKRTRPMSCFQNTESVDRIIYGIISHLNSNWKAKPLQQFTHNT